MSVREASAVVRSAENGIARISCRAVLVVPEDNLSTVKSRVTSLWASNQRVFFTVRIRLWMHVRLHPWWLWSPDVSCPVVWNARVQPRFLIDFHFFFFFFFFFLAVPTVPFL